MSVDGELTIFDVVSSLISVANCVSYFYTMYWQPIQLKECMTCTLPQNENESHQSVNSFSFCVLGDQGIVQMYQLTTELLTALISKSRSYNRKIMDSKIIDMANSKTCKNRFLAAEYVILITYCYQTAKTSALSESIDGPAWQPIDNLPN